MDYNKPPKMYFLLHLKQYICYLVVLYLYEDRNCRFLTVFLKALSFPTNLRNKCLLQEKNFIAV